MSDNDGGERPQSPPDEMQGDDEGLPPMVRSRSSSIRQNDAPILRPKRTSPGSAQGSGPRSRPGSGNVSPSVKTLSASGSPSSQAPSPGQLLKQLPGTGENAAANEMESMSVTPPGSSRSSTRSSKRRSSQGSKTLGSVAEGDESEEGPAPKPSFTEFVPYTAPGTIGATERSSSDSNDSKSGSEKSDDEKKERMPAPPGLSQDLKQMSRPIIIPKVVVDEPTGEGEGSLSGSGTSEPSSSYSSKGSFKRKAGTLGNTSPKKSKVPGEPSEESPRAGPTTRSRGSAPTTPGSSAEAPGSSSQTPRRRSQGGKEDH